MIRFNRASEFPTISTNPSIASSRNSQNQSYSPLRTSAAGEFVLPFDFSYEVDFWGRVRRTVNAAREEAQATSADLATATLTIQSELAYDYFEPRAADAQKQLLVDTVKAYSDALQLTKNPFEGGASPKSDVAQAQTQLDTTAVQEADIDVQRAAYEHAIATLLGRPPAEFGLVRSRCTRSLPSSPSDCPHNFWSTVPISLPQRDASRKRTNESESRARHSSPR
jgi:outer membrane protein TolC